MDIKWAYVNAPIDEEIFLEQPKELKQCDGDIVCKLKRPLYGLKQSMRNWYECLTHRLEQMEFFRRSTTSVFGHKRGVTINAGHWCGMKKLSTVQMTRTLDNGLRQIWAKVHNWWLCPSCAVPGHCIQSGASFHYFPYFERLKTRDQRRQKRKNLLELSEIFQLSEKLQLTIIHLYGVEDVLWILSYLQFRFLCKLPFLVGAFLAKSARLLQWLVFFFFFRQTTTSLWLVHFSFNRNC